MPSGASTWEAPRILYVSLTDELEIAVTVQAIMPASLQFASVNC